MTEVKMKWLGKKEDTYGWIDSFLKKGGTGWYWNVKPKNIDDQDGSVFAKITGFCPKSTDDSWNGCKSLDADTCQSTS